MLTVDRAFLGILSCHSSCWGQCNESCMENLNVSMWYIDSTKTTNKFVGGSLRVWVRWYANAMKDLCFSDFQMSATSSSNEHLLSGIIFENAVSYLTKHMSISVVNKHMFEIHLSKIQSGQTGFSLNQVKSLT